MRKSVSHALLCMFLGAVFRRAHPVQEHLLRSVTAQRPVDPDGGALLLVGAVRVKTTTASNDFLSANLSGAHACKLSWKYRLNRMGTDDHSGFRPEAANPEHWKARLGDIELQVDLSRQSTSVSPK